MKVEHISLGRLEPVDIRSVWAHEERDFSVWLSDEDNIELLGDTLGLGLTSVQREVLVGAYRCDIVAIDEDSETKVIIENQLESTNYDHLGKIITYASGLEAGIIVWIVKEAREEHRSAIEWLNNKTTDDVSFFLIEVRAYKIGDSSVAPQFVIIEQPNDFLKFTKNNSDNSELTKGKIEIKTFWNEFNDVLKQRREPFNTTKTSTRRWFNIGIGSSDAHMLIRLKNREHHIRIEVYIKESKELFDKLYEEKEAIEKKLGFEMVWNRAEHKKSSQIIYVIDGLDFDDHSNYKELMNEVIDKTIVIRDVFKKYIK